MQSKNAKGPTVQYSPLRLTSGILWELSSQSTGTYFRLSKTKTEEMNSIFRNLPHEKAKRKRDKIGHFRIAFSADTKSYPVSCQHLSDLWRSTLEIGAAQPSLRYRNHAARSLQASSPIWASEASLARTRAHFAYPNRRACSQATPHGTVLQHCCKTS